MGSAIRARDKAPIWLQASQLRSASAAGMLGNSAIGSVAIKRLDHSQGNLHERNWNMIHLDAL